MNRLPFKSNGTKKKLNDFQAVDNETPLHCAAQHGHTGALTTLLAHGANPNMENTRGEKPLDLAAQYGRFEVVQMLIRQAISLIFYLYSFNLTTAQQNKCI